ncbi:MAG: type II toxin-antitoxin system RelE/ParE family toxin [Bacteroidota bacterium]
MLSYKIVWKESALKELLKIDKVFIPKIINIVESLSSNPHPRNTKKLFNSESTYRIRIGPYRIIYTVSAGNLLIEIIRVAHRKDVYR